jgi:hypothetical protein
MEVQPKGNGLVLKTNNTRSERPALIAESLALVTPGK